MNLIQFITLGVIIIIAAIAIFLYKKKNKNNLIELNCKFIISNNADELLNTYKKEVGVVVDGILGNDFLNKHGYIIDYNSLLIKHKSVKISIKESIDILELPLIALYQGNKKYVFLIDTGATGSLIHSKHLDSIIHNANDNESFSLYGFGGMDNSTKSISTSLYYRMINVN